MMRRGLVPLTIVAVMLTAAVATEVRLREMPLEDPLGRELLYIPSYEVLKVLSLGNPGLMADLVYLWSIQYYSYFQPNERFLYLEKVYNLITDLDPKYFDAYRIGALIMGIQVAVDQNELKQAAQRLFDKGLRNLPESWELAEFAAWDMYLRDRDRLAAIHYAEIAAAIPGAPPRLKRILGVWRDKANVWSVEDSIAYWEQAVANAENEFDLFVCRNKLYDAYLNRDRQRLQPLIDAYVQRTGSCEDGWGGLIRAGLVRQVPLDYSGNPYGIDREACTLVAHKKIRDQ
jgi:hypothetical protein